MIQYSFDGGSLPNILPPLKNMTVVGGPSQMNGSSTINGVTTTTSQLTYEVIFTTPGDYTIPSSTVVVKGKKYSSPPVNVKVIKGNSAPIIPAVYKDKEVILRSQATGNKVYLGQPIAIDLLAYSFTMNLGLTDIKLPSFDGGWAKDAENVPEERMKASTYEGIPYYKGLMRRVWMIPGVVGQIEYKPVDATFVAAVKDPKAGYMEFNYQVKSNAIQFEVLALPVEKKPVSFVNAVGEFTWTVTINKLSAKANEPVKCIVNVEGSGNLPTLEAPVLNVPAEFEVFEPKVTNSFKTEMNGITGNKQFEYLIMPREEGTYTLGAFEFSYFNPSSKKYITLQSDSFNVKIEGVIKDTTKTNSNINEGKFDGKAPYKPGATFFGTVVYYILLGLPFIMALLMIFFRKKIFFTKKDPTVKLSKLAENKAYKLLEETLSKSGKDAVSALSGAFFQYIGDKFSLAKNDITRANLKQYITDPSLENKGILIMDQLDQFRFAPAAESDIQSLHSTIKNFVDELGKK